MYKFFQKTSLWIVFLVGTLFFGMMMGGLCYLMLDETMLRMGSSLTEVSIRIGLVVGTLFGIITALLTQMSRKSVIFWEAANNLDERIKQCNDKESLLKLYENDFNSLRKLAMGSPHDVELMRIYTIIKTKYNCI